MYDHLNGNGSTIQFATSRFTAEIKSFTEPPESVEILDKTHLGSRWTERRPGKVHNAGEMTLTIIYDPDDVPPIGGPMESILITYPKPSGATTGASRRFRGFISSFEPAEVANDAIVEATITIAVDGPIRRSPSNAPPPPVEESAAAASITATTAPEGSPDAQP